MITRRQPPVIAGREYVLEPEQLVAGGDALARIEGFPIFTPGIYPGDEALVRITELKPGFGRGMVVRLLRGGDHRKESPCPVSETCGGCDWTSLRLDLQLQAKKRILMESLQRVGKLDPASLPPIQIHPSPLNYRLRSRLHVDSERGVIGFFEVGTHQVVPLPAECEVVGPKVIAHLSDLERLAANDLRSIQTLETESELVIELTSEPSRELEVSIRLREFKYVLSLSSFFQVNRHLLGLLIDLVTAHARSGGTNALDLYAGVGFFTLPLARLFARITAVEASSESSAFGRRNAAPYDNVTFLSSDVERFLESAAEEADFVMIDPPRAGLGAAVPELLSHTAAKKICYLSCDPVTFSRDALRLVRCGWTLSSLDLVDLFPNTHHVETLSSFERAR